MTLEKQREAVVYLLRDTKTLLPFYVGSTIRESRRKSDHMVFRKHIRTNRSIMEYVLENNIEYSFEVIHRISGRGNDILRMVRRLEQKYILKSRYKLLNKKNPLTFITAIKNKYPWLSNKTLNKTIVI